VTGSVRPPARGGRPKAADAERLGDAVLEAARTLFTTIGYERTSMDQVAADAGVSKRTVYSRFGTKAQLFSTIIGQLGHKRLDEIEAVAVPEGTPREVLHGLAQLLIDLSINPEIIALERLTADMSHDFPEIAEIRAHQSQRMIAIIMRYLEQIQNDEPAPVEQLKHDAMVFLSMTLLPKLHRAMMRRPATLEDEDAHVSRAVDIFLYGYGR